MTKKVLLLSGVVLLLGLGILWYRLGFTFDLSRFFAAGGDNLTVVCGATQNVLTWTYNPIANSNSIQRGNGGPKNLPECADYWCWLPTSTYPHQLPTSGQTATYTDTQLQPGVCYGYRIKYQPIIPSNTVYCPANCDVPPPTTHLACVNNACTAVAGGGANTCATNVDCAPAPTHMACVNNACTSVAGAGTNTCATNAECAPAPTAVMLGICDTPDVTRVDLNWTVNGTQTVNIVERQDNGGAFAAIFQEQGPPFNRHAYPDTQIVFGHTYVYRLQIAPGVYSNTVIIAASAATCNAPPTTHLACVNNACTAVAGGGANTCATNVDCAPAPTHMACVNNACTSVAGAGTNTCATNAECAPATHMACVNNACTSVAGAGTNQCTTNTDCAPATHLACVNNACVSVTGAGANQCSSSANCQPSPSQLVCAPVSQTAAINQSVSLQASGGSGAYGWSAPGSTSLNQSGSSVSVRYASSGTYNVLVQDSESRTATCSVVVVGSPTPSPTSTPVPGSPALSIQKVVRSVTRNGPEASSISANPSETVEFTIRVSSIGSVPAPQVVVRDTLPSGLTYQNGTTTVDGVGASDGVTGAGLSVGDLVAGRSVTIRFRAVLADTAFFPTGTTTLTNVANAQSNSVSVSTATTVNGTALVLITRGTPAQVPTGPAESAVLALIVSTIITLLYVGYTSTDMFRMREATGLARTAKKDKSLGDFKG